MDLGKGLLRLWIFLSFLWILLVFWQDRPHEAFREYHIAQKALGDDDGVYSKAEIITAAEKAEAAGDMLAAVRLMRVADGVANGPGGTFKTEERLKLDQALARLQASAWLTLTPIILLLVVGAGMLWVFRGFKRDQS